MNTTAEQPQRDRAGTRAREDDEIHRDIWWRYHHGQFSVVSDPTSADGWPPPEWVHADTWGIDDAFMIYNRPGGWCVELCFDASNMYFVLIDRLPDLIELLAKIAPIALASLDHHIRQ